jgi:C-terminal processing protease CtpA/Prc
MQTIQEDEGTPNDIAELGIEFCRHSESGFLQVAFLKPHCPAQTSGMIHAGDVIKAVRSNKDTTWQSTEDLSEMEARKKCSGPVGTLIRVRILRGEVQYDSTIELARPWMPAKTVNFRQRDSAHRRVAPDSGNKVQNKIHKGMAKINACQKPTKPDTVSEEEREALKFQRMMQERDPEPRAQHSYRGRVVS